MPVLTETIPLSKMEDLARKSSASDPSRLLSGADGETRTLTAFATAPSRRRVYQFHHVGVSRKRTRTAIRWGSPLHACALCYFGTSCALPPSTGATGAGTGAACPGVCPGICPGTFCVVTG